jgi:hypothetical protein
MKDPPTKKIMHRIAINFPFLLQTGLETDTKAKIIVLETYRRQSVQLSFTQNMRLRLNM